MFAEKLTLTGRSKIRNNFRTYGMRYVTRQKSWNKISSFYDHHKRRLILKSRFSYPVQLKSVFTIPDELFGQILLQTISLNSKV